MSTERPRQRYDWVSGTDTYNYGSGTYDGEASVVEPADNVASSVADFQDGFKPEAGLPAEYLNERLQALGKWIAYYSEIEFKNWSIANVAVNSVTGNAVAWVGSADSGAEGRGRWVVVGGDPAVNGCMSSRNGHNWEVLGPMSGGAVTPALDVDGRPDSNQILAVGSVIGAQRVYRRNTSDVWSDYDIAGWKFFKSIHWSTTFSLWAIGARQTADDKAKVLTGTDAAAWTERNLPGANTGTSIPWIATGNSKGICIDDGGTPKSWYSTDGTTWTEYAGFSAAITGAVKSLCHCTADGYFYLVTASRCYRSTDGQSWTDMGAHGFTPITATKGLVAHGKVLVTADTAWDAIAYSIDGGATWKREPYPFTGAAVVTSIASSGRRLVFVATVGGNSFDAGVSLNLGQR